MQVTLDQLDAALEHLRAAPSDQASIIALFARPDVDQRQDLTIARLAPGQGMEGDDWSRRLRSDGSPPHPDRELTLIGSRILTLVAGPRERWSLAGDQVVVDFDLSERNLPVGQTLRLGQARIVITDQPHLGCGKFSQRFGADALKFVNRPALRPLRLRGVYARVLDPGEVKLGDSIIRL
jgi:MOSC domain-containing protein YiiM